MLRVLVCKAGCLLLVAGMTSVPLLHCEQFVGYSNASILTAKYDAEYQKVYKYGRVDSKFRSAYDTESAFFWSAVPGMLAVSDSRWHLDRTGLCVWEALGELVGVGMPC
jgi:hypothetical protein